MSQEHEEELSLASLAQGAAEELFAYELGRVLANVADVNTTVHGSANRAARYASKLEARGRERYEAREVDR